MIIEGALYLQIFEITTIAGRLQRYETIEVSPMTFTNGQPGTTIKNLTRKEGDSCIDELAIHAHSVYSMTGLDEAIKQYPYRILTEHDGERFTHVKIASAKKLRLIYDAFPLETCVPILMVCPVNGEQICVVEYDLKNARLPLEKMTFNQEFEGSLDLKFAGLQVLLHLRNFEAENEKYYSGNLKESKIRKD